MPVTAITIITATINHIIAIAAPTIILCTMTMFITVITAMMIETSTKVSRTRREPNEKGRKSRTNMRKWPLKVLDRLLRR